MSVLDSIIEGVRDDLAERMRHTPLEHVKELASIREAAIDVVPAWRQAEHISLIAEVKRSSPSKGALGDIPDPAALAAEYEAGGASAISVLTERRRFGGSLADLDAITGRVSLPVLRKDFMVEDYQIYEARAHGASLVLLIVAALNDEELGRMYNLARSLGMRALIETHNEKEIERALALEASIIGVNARDLTTLEVDRTHAARLVRTIPADRLAVAESAVLTLGDCRDYAAAGADAVLVGEGLVTNAAPRDAASKMASLVRLRRS